MNHRLFASFCELIDAVPAKRILQTVEEECLVIDDELVHKRIAAKEDALSILNFCRFLKTVTHGVVLFPSALPARHIASFGKIIDRLIAAGELPTDARAQFDHTFSQTS